MIAPPSTRTQRGLTEAAKHVALPAGITGTHWIKLRRSIRRKLGVQFDGWQDGAGKVMFSYRANGRLATTIGGFGMSAPRQIGKTYFMAPTLFGLSIERPKTLSLWSAHHSKTHNETFLEMQSFAKLPQVQPFVADVFTGSGDEAVVFTNDSRILFGARERGFGRGIPNVDVEVFDEAQILSMKALENQLAAMNRSNLGLHVYLGTPPKPGDMSEAFEAMRDEALAALKTGDPLDLSWIEFGADDDADLDDRGQWAKANPSYPEHTSDESMMRLRKKLGPDGMRREGLGIWPKDLKTVFDLVAWVSLEYNGSAYPKRVALAAHVAEFQTESAIAVAGEMDDGSTLMLVFVEPGMDWVADKIAELDKSHDLAEVALCPGEARGLAGDLTRLGVEHKPLTQTDIAASCSAFLSDVASSAKAVGRGDVAKLRHGGQTELDTAITRARTRKIGPATTWDEGTDSALVAASAAAYKWSLQEAPMPSIW